ncbi:MAG: hypothetical protein DGJ47_000775 [Rickettsiaceae bacterium]
MHETINHDLQQQEFSVSEVSSKIKQLLESSFNSVRIKGEISGLKIAASGHGYFSLKDEKSVISAICWRGTLAKSSFKLSEGMEVIVQGKITAYAGQSKYQISVESIQPSGIGAFMKILSERKVKFQQEGLFAKEKKQKIPFLPKKIGIVTSISGAVIKDIIHRISDRCHTHIIIWPVSVQGATSAQEVTDAINGFNKMNENEKPDLLIIARGGGSIEDLWSFNEEIVIRAAFASNIPLISAIGHETDYTLLDLVADLRAPTPTAAAEFAMPVASDLEYTLSTLQNRLSSRLTDFIKYYQQKIIASASSLNYTHNIIKSYEQKIDDLTFRFQDSLPNMVKHKAAALHVFPISRMNPIRIIKYKYLQYQNAQQALIRHKEKLLNNYENQLKINANTLSSLDYKKVMQRGYAMIEHNDQIISHKQKVSKQDQLTVKMHDGNLKVTVNYIN